MKFILQRFPEFSIFESDSVGSWSNTGISACFIIVLTLLLLLLFSFSACKTAVPEKISLKVPLLPSTNHIKYYIFYYIYYIKLWKYSIL